MNDCMKFSYKLNSTIKLIRKEFVLTHKHLANARVFFF